MDNEELVTVATFANSMEAGVARGYLESEGIDCCVIDENVSQIMPYLDGLVGGVKLQVRESDEVAARALLEDAEEAEGLDEDETED